MKSILVRDVPEMMLEKLKRRAQQHHRSLQKEIHALLAEAARSIPDGPNPGKLALKTVATRNSEPWTREEYYDHDGR